MTFDYLSHTSFIFTDYRSLNNHEHQVIGVLISRDVSDFGLCVDGKKIHTFIRPMLPYDSRIFVNKNIENMYSFIKRITLFRVYVHNN
jgi:hypothetical protein